MNKKIVIAGVVIIILAIGGGFVLTKKDDKKTNTSTSQTASNKVAATDAGTSSDSGKEDIGACTSVSASTIKSALGGGGANIGNVQDTGAIGLGDGDKGQTCVYPFEEGAAISNSFYIDLASYATQTTFDDASRYSGGDGTAISGIGDSASYSSKDINATNAHEFILTVKKDKKIWLFAISQPITKVTYTDTDAQTALKTIASAAKL